MGALNRRQFVRTGALAVAAASGRGLIAQANATSSTVLKTAPGTLQGAMLEGVRVFRGVPFAEPPIGDLRFRAPVAKRGWMGTRDATHFASAAVQESDRGLSQSEDCLYLNIWTPKIVPGNSTVPVLVWIHGGGFTGGNSFAPIFDGTEFAKTGMVVVTVAYRLGVLGFLDLEPLLGSEYAGSGNNGLCDVIAALGWVKTNIAAFGGDPSRVTVGGESAGAKLTDILMGVPTATELFQSMVSESGGAERLWPKTTAQSVADGFGKAWTKSEKGRIIAGLKTAPARALIEAQTDLLRTWPQHFPLRCEVDGVLIPRLPVQTIAAGSAKGKRLLIGTNRDESALFVGPRPEHDATAQDLGNVSVATFDGVYAQYATVYPDMPVEQRRIRALTAEEYSVPSVRVADAAVNGGATAWMYELDFARAGGRLKGEAFHSEDLDLVWNKPNREYTSAAAEATLAGQVHGAWAAFVRGEAPSAPGLPLWPEYNVKTRPVMLLDAASRAVQQPQELELRLWDGVL